MTSSRLRQVAQNASDLNRAADFYRSRGTDEWQASSATPRTTWSG